MSQETYVQEYNAIIDVLTKYTRGNAEGDSSFTRQAFHPDATIFGYDGKSVFGPEVSKLYDVVDTFPKSPDARVAIGRVDIVGNAASARVDSENIAGYSFSDFFNLLKIEGKWSIVNKIYYTHPSN